MNGTPRRAVISLSWPAVSNASCWLSITHGPAMSPKEAADPDLSFRAYLTWCARQPATPSATLEAWRTGRFAFDSGLVTA